MGRGPVLRGLRVQTRRRLGWIPQGVFALGLSPRGCRQLALQGAELTVFGCWTTQAPESSCPLSLDPHLHV